jgi:sugar-specific transcriptional regulator TrmB
MDIYEILKKLGFDDKDIQVYLTLFSLGPCSVRKLSQKSGVNRGTTYDILKQLKGRGLVSYYHKEKKQYFVAEDPRKLENYLARSIEELNSMRERVRELIPELESIYKKGGIKPVARYFEGRRGVRFILEDVLLTLSLEQYKEYYVYSSADVRDELYKNFPDFTLERISRGISVKVIALGNGGDPQPLSERKWLSRTDATPSYTLIYGNKTAHICICAKEKEEIRGVVIEDEGIAETQKLIFEKLWEMI